MDWLTELFYCPACEGELQPTGPAEGGAGLLVCDDCELPVPLLGGVPILVPSPSAWAAAYRESVLATLAEERMATPEVVTLVSTLADAVGPVEALRFGDDWVAAETGGGLPEPVRGPASAALSELFAVASPQPAAAMLDLLIAPRHGTVLEVGCGAGTLVSALGDRSERLVVADMSLRAVYRSLAVRSTAETAGAVVDAELLPFRPGSFDLIVANHLIDLLDAPLEFLASARQSLRPQGRLLLSTPDPVVALELEDMLAVTGFRVEGGADGIPWLRAHNARHVQVYLTRALVASCA